MNCVLILSFILWNSLMITNANFQDKATNGCISKNCAAPDAEYQTENKLQKEQPVVISGRTGKAELNKGATDNKLEPVMFMEEEVIPFLKKNKRRITEKKRGNQKNANLENQIAQMMKDAYAKMHRNPK